MIEAKVICDSVANGIRLTTMELNYHRFIHSEFLTHRLFSRNASSSRAIPVKKMLEQVRDNPAMPIHWGKNQPGMQAREECDNYVETLSQNRLNDVLIVSREEAWKDVAYYSSYFAEKFDQAGYHKQIVNRLTESMQYIKVIVTATEWDNFFKLRLHPDAQPEIKELARCMKIAMDNSVPQEMTNGRWHLPYITNKNFVEMMVKDYSLHDAIKCSVARCARVSYMNHDNTSPDIKKDLELADRLLAAGHMSPFEHQATPMRDDQEFFVIHWDKGITHMDRDENFWSGNFRGWIQNRQIL